MLVLLLAATLFATQQDDAIHKRLGDLWARLESDDITVRDGAERTIEGLLDREDVVRWIREAIKGAPSNAKAVGARLLEIDAERRMCWIVFIPSIGNSIPMDTEEMQITVVRADGEKRHQLTSGRGIRQHPAVSPDGRRVAFVCREQVHVIDMDGRNERKLTSSPEQKGHPSFSPDGSSIVYISYGVGTDRNWAVRLLRLLEGKDQVIVKDGRNDQAMFLPDGKRILFLRITESGRCEMRIANMDGSEERMLTNGVDMRSVSLSPDGSSLVFRTVYPDDRGAAFRVLDLKSEGFRDLVTSNRAIPYHATVGASGDLFYNEGGSGDPGIVRIRLDGSGAERLHEIPGEAVHSVSVSPDGKWLTYTTGRGRDGLFKLHVLDLGRKTLCDLGSGTEAVWVRPLRR